MNNERSLAKEITEGFEALKSIRNNEPVAWITKKGTREMTDYSENYLKIQRLLKLYHNATLKWDYEKATKIAHELADETIRLEIASVRALKDQWLK